MNTILAPLCSGSVMLVSSAPVLLPRGAARQWCAPSKARVRCCAYTQSSFNATSALRRSWTSSKMPGDSFTSCGESAQR
jgi:hypothetical protein